MTFPFVIFLAICLICPSMVYSTSTYNDIDGCWMGPDWADDRQRLADCATGFGAGTTGGKGGQFYLVNTTEDDPADPKPGMLRWGATRYEPLWIVFQQKQMVFRFKEELIINSYKTFDGRGSDVYIAGPACLVVQSVQEVILHNLHVYNCVPTGGDGRTMVMSTPDHVGWRLQTGGDAVSIWAAKHVWVDHLYLANSSDGLIDAVEGSTRITVSNCRLTDHNEAMLFGHSDSYTGDKSLQATFIYNHFSNLVQRCPRCREGFCEVVNNVYFNWTMYAIGGSAGITFKSQGNSYNASDNPFAKEVTKRVTCENCSDWNWISEDDLMLNGAYFVPSGSKDPSSRAYANATSVRAKDSKRVYNLTRLAGTLKCNEDLQCWS